MEAAAEAFWCVQEGVESSAGSRRGLRAAAKLAEPQVPLGRLSGGPGELDGAPEIAEGSAGAWGTRWGLVWPLEERRPL